LSIGVEAFTTRFTYNGQSIRGLASIGSTNVNAGQTIRVNHAQTHWNNVSVADQIMEVRIQRQSGFIWQNVTHAVFTGTFSGHRSFTHRVTNGGTHRLYFHAPRRPAAADINGSFQVQ